jgi:succinate dehydrogenase/fumarate reductase iron-sulfur protein
MRPVALKVRRTDATGREAARWQRFSVPRTEESMSVLDTLIWVQRNADPSLAFRCACRVGMCGTCGTVINGREDLACRALVRDLIEDGAPGGEIRVEPMRNMPVIRDLVTDMSIFNAKNVRAVLAGSHIPDEGISDIAPASRERQKIDPQRECVNCGLCYSACTIAGLDDGFLGPAALNRAFVSLADSRTKTRTNGLEAVAHEQGLWRCHTLFECTAVCPKGISPTLAIQRLKRRVVGSKLKRLLRIGA